MSSIKRIQFAATIQAPVAVVWRLMFGLESYRRWTSAFTEGSTYEGSWQQGERIRFLSPSGDGMVAEIAERRDHEFISIRHLGCITKGLEDTTSEAVRAWAPAYENYSFSAMPEGTRLVIDQDVAPDFEAFMTEAWPKALDLLKRLCEDEPRVAPITDANPSVDDMLARVARFRDLKPTDDYLDAAIPGCERTTLRVLGHPSAAPLAAEGFHMNIVHCEPGKAAPLHNHLTQEVFVVLTGQWEVFWGPQGERRVLLEAWDTISVPPGVSRGFRNIGPEPAYLMGMASGQDPGMINWPPQVRAAALAAGVALP